jgi:hypothetical protein
MKTLEAGCKESLWITVQASEGTNFARNLPWPSVVQKSSTIRSMRSFRVNKCWLQSLSDKPDTMCITATGMYTMMTMGWVLEESSGILKWSARDMNLDAQH